MEYDESAPERRPKGNPYLIPASIVIASLVFSAAWLYGGRFGGAGSPAPKGFAAELSSAFDDKELFPEGGVELPVTWGDLGAKLVSVGAIDRAKFEGLYEARGGMTDEYRKLLDGEDNGKIVIDENNAGFILNLFWALGLANKSPVLERGPMMDPKYGGAQGFASTGGWTLSAGDPMGHYSKHMMFPMTPEQHALAEKVAQGVYRPCCNNSTHFPDCNHGMAMLGLLELMASQGATEDEMYSAALKANAYWFPDAYAMIAEYERGRGKEWKDADPKTMLGKDYSSASGFKRVMGLASGGQQRPGGAGGCGV